MDKKQCSELDALLEAVDQSVIPSAQKRIIRKIARKGGIHEARRLLDALVLHREFMQRWRLER